ncbi:hypothetical protein GCM10029964_026670 [Kibdelosporangium lantanae]
MQWAVDQGAKIVNLSLGAPDEPGIDPLEEAVNELSKTGTLFVIAAGNSGGDETVGSPGSADAALTVGAVDRQDNLAPFSSRGPRTGDGAIKPDITAPGVGIVAAKAAEGRIGTPPPTGTWHWTARRWRPRTWPGRPRCWRRNTRRGPGSSSRPR